MFAMMQKQAWGGYSACLNGISGRAPTRFIQVITSDERGGNDPA
jgi:hypothetical protein